MQGHLIIHQQSFDWNDISINRCQTLRKFFDSRKEAREHGDMVYNNIEIFKLNFSWGNFYNILFGQVKIAWLSQTDIQVLKNILLSSPNKIFNEFKIEFINFNHGEIGLLYEECPSNLVYDIPSWKKFHEEFVAKFTFEEQCENFAYFKMFYKSELKIAANQINDLIRNGRAHASIIRLDIPLVPNEKMHIHFLRANEQSCALNIDGTWKHEIDGFIIPNEACENLSDWGFVLPDEYYQ